MKTEIYFDHAATTKLRSKALDAMLPYLQDSFGNPSGTYALARQSAKAIDEARRSVAKTLGCRPQEIVFTGHGTESINAAIKGIAFAQQQAGMGNHIVTSNIEHHAVQHSCDYLEKFGFETTYVPVDEYGLVDPAAVANAVNERTVLVSVMLANNEVGTIEPMAEISAAVHERALSMRRQIPVHTDAVQGANSLDLRIEKLGVDVMSLSAHKFGGPKGAGILYMRRGTPFLSQESGGGQERQRRAGTENVAGIVGTSVALHEAQANREAYVEVCAPLSRRITDSIVEAIPGAILNGHPKERLPNNVHISFEGAESDAMLSALDKLDIAASAGSACTSATWEPSHVLTAMGIPLRAAAGVLRITFGPENTDDEADYLLSVLPKIVADSRADAGASAK
ncbi:MAG: cysteine desulfurase [Chloroflexi bacterium]|nr:cysteine desulfurase [Chloroflexota bacterium]